jgi:hypothetical protein
MKSIYKDFIEMKYLVSWFQFVSTWVTNSMWLEKVIRNVNLNTNYYGNYKRYFRNRARD